MDDRIKKLKSWIQVNGKKPLADIRDLNNLSTFKEGIDQGFVFNKSHDYIGIDFDNVIVNGETNPLVLEWIRKFNSYTEFSRSLSGYHILVKSDKAFLGDIFPSQGGYNRRGKAEIYIYGRQFVLTGNIAFDKSVINEVDDELIREFVSWIKGKAKPKTDISVRSPKMSDNAILTKIGQSKKREAFQKLANRPAVKGNSEGDQALAGHLAFYTQDVQQIVGIMRQCKCYRPEKYDRDDWIEGLVEKAIANRTGTWQPRQTPSIVDHMNTPKITDADKPWLETIFVKGVPKLRVLCPLLAEKIRTELHYIFVQNTVKESIQRYLYTDGYYKPINDEIFKGIIKQYIPLEAQTTRDLSEVLGLLYTDLNFISVDNLNPERIINFKNGILDLKSWKLLDHDPKYLCTIQIPVDYNPVKPESKGLFKAFIDHLAKGDADTIRLLLEFMGVAISNVNGYRMKKALILKGPHDTGKSVLKAFMARLLGNEYVSGASLEQLETRFTAPKLFNKRLVGSSDMPYMHITELNTFKQLTGGDPIDSEYKNENSFTFTFRGVLWFCCNLLPRFGGDKADDVYKRMLVVECDNLVPKKDKHLVDKLMAEKEYIVHVCIEALRMLIKRGFKYTIPEGSKLIRESFMHWNNTFSQFMLECIDILPEGGKTGNGCKKSKMLTAYRNWCRVQNVFPEKSNTVNSFLSSKNLHEIRHLHGISYYVKLSLNKEANDYLV